MGAGGLRRLRRIALGALSGIALGVLPIDDLPLPLPDEPPELPTPDPGPERRPGGQLERIYVRTSGDDSELIQRLPITRHPGVRPRVAMSLGPSQLPTLRRGDRLQVSTEVQVSTTCIDRTRRCIGKGYAFNPVFRARLVVARSRRATSERVTLPLARRRSVRCYQTRPNRNHHCTLVFSAPSRRVKLVRLPCARTKCHLNVVVDAYHPRAERGNVLVLGGDRPGGRVSQDKGRLNLLLTRRKAPRPVGRRVAHARRERSLPLERGGSDARRVLYSVPLTGLRAGEKLLVKGRHLTALPSSFPGNAYIHSELILASRPGGTSPGRAARRVGTLHGRISEANGFNCTHGDSAFESPCLTRKVGVMKVRRDATDVLRAPATLYVNLVARAKPLLHSADEGERVRVFQGGRLKVVRYR